MATWILIIGALIAFYIFGISSHFSKLIMDIITTGIILSGVGLIYNLYVHIKDRTR